MYVLCNICVPVCVRLCVRLCVRAACVWFAIYFSYAWVGAWVYASNTLALVRLCPSWSRVLILPMGHVHITHTCFNMSHLRKHYPCSH